MYRSNISDARWIAYDIPGNIGWIAFLAGLFLCFAKRPECMNSDGIRALLLLDLLCGAVMICGVVELVSERILRLDRVLPQKRLYRGFGALTFGGLAGMIVSLLALALALLTGPEGTAYLGILCGGGLLCFVFGGLILKEYKRI